MCHFQKVLHSLYLLSHLCEVRGAHFIHQHATTFVLQLKRRIIHIWLDQWVGGVTLVSRSHYITSQTPTFPRTNSTLTVSRVSSISCQSSIVYLSLIFYN